MNKFRYVKAYADPQFFELPKNIIASKYNCHKFQISASKVSTDKVDVFLCNKTSSLDKLFLTPHLDFCFVFLKDEIVRQIYLGTLTGAKKKQLITAIERLKTAFISLVIFPEIQTTIFGDYSPLPRQITDFIKQIGLSVRLITLAGSYFAHPIWADHKRLCNVKLEQRFNISSKELSLLSLEEFNEKLNNLTPSSATVYSKKYPLFLRDNKIAEGLEQIFYVCPNCLKSFSLYCEFNCVKCRECGSALEISRNFDIDLCKEVRNLDEFKQFQFSVLSACKFTNKPVKVYKNITFCECYLGQFLSEKSATLAIYDTKIVLTAKSEELSIKFAETGLIQLDYNNRIFIDILGKKRLAITAPKHENLFVILDLFKIYKSKNK